MQRVSIVDLDGQSKQIALISNLVPLDCPGELSLIDHASNHTVMGNISACTNSYSRYSTFIPLLLYCAVLDTCQTVLSRINRKYHDTKPLLVIEALAVPKFTIYS